MQCGIVVTGELSGVRGVLDGAIHLPSEHREAGGADRAGDAVDRVRPLGEHGVVVDVAAEERHEAGEHARLREAVQPLGTGRGDRGRAMGVSSSRDAGGAAKPSKNGMSPKDRSTSGTRSVASHHSSPAAMLGVSSAARRGPRTRPRPSRRPRSARAAGRGPRHAGPCHFRVARVVEPFGHVLADHLEQPVATWSRRPRSARPATCRRAPGAGRTRRRRCPPPWRRRRRGRTRPRTPRADGAGPALRERGARQDQSMAARSVWCRSSAPWRPPLAALNRRSRRFSISTGVISAVRAAASRSRVGCRRGVCTAPDRARGAIVDRELATCSRARREQAPASDPSTDRLPTSEAVTTRAGGRCARRELRGLPGGRDTETPAAWVVDSVTNAATAPTRCSQLSSTSSKRLCSRRSAEPTDTGTAGDGVYRSATATRVVEIVRVVDGCELAQPHAVGMVGQHGRADLERQAGLAHTADADDRDEARFVQAGGHVGELLLVANEAAQLVGEVRQLRVERTQRWCTAAHPEPRPGRGARCSGGRAAGARRGRPRRTRRARAPQRCACTPLARRDRPTSRGPCSPRCRTSRRARSPPHPRVRPCARADRSPPATPQLPVTVEPPTAVVDAVRRRTANAAGPPPPRALFTTDHRAARALRPGPGATGVPGPRPGAHHLGALLPRTRSSPSISVNRNVRN